jgi:hypothetical protein
MASNLWFGTPVLAGVGPAGIAYCRVRKLRRDHGHGAAGGDLMICWENNRFVRLSAARVLEP